MRILTVLALITHRPKKFDLFATHEPVTLSSRVVKLTSMPVKKNIALIGCFQHVSNRKKAGSGGDTSMNDGDTSRMGTRTKLLFYMEDYFTLRYVRIYATPGIG